MEKNLPLPKSTIHTVITTDIEKILGTIIFRTRLAKGWNPYDKKTQDFAIQTWFEILSRHKIPSEYFDELYGRACEVRTKFLQNGKEPPEVSAELMAAQWKGLQEEILKKEIEARRTLPETAQSKCPRCFGVGIEMIYSENGNPLGARPGCQHKKLEPGEWLWQKEKEAAEKAAKYEAVKV